MEKKLKGYAVIKNVPFTPNEWFGAYTVFRNKKDAEYWLKTRVDPSNKAKVVVAEISFNTTS